VAAALAHQRGHKGASALVHCDTVRCRLNKKILGLGLRIVAYPTHSHIVGFCHVLPI